MSTSGVRAGAPDAPDGNVAIDGAAGGLFVRKSSGLVREIGLRDAFAINMAGVNPTGIGFFFFVILAGFPGTNLTWPIILTLGAAILLSAVYSQLTATMPRSGADYVYISRIFHPFLGAAVGVAYFIVLALTLGANVAVLVDTYLPSCFQTLGSVFHVSALTSFGNDLAGHTGAVIGSCVVMLAIGILMLRRVQLAARATFWAFVLGLVAVAILVFEFLFHTSGAFRTAFDHHVGSGQAYSALIASANHQGIRTGVHWSAVWASVALAFGLYGGATYANFTGGELSRPGWTYRLSTFACLAVAFVATLAAWLTLEHTVGLRFLQASASLSTNDPTAYGKLAGGISAYVPSYGLLIAGDPVTKILIAIGFPAGVFSLCVAVALIMSRILFALSFDRVLPTAVANVRPKTHAPLTASVITIVAGILTAVLTIETTILTVTRNSYLALVFIFALSSLAATLMPWIRPDLYGQAPRMLGPDRKGIPAITLIGAVSTVVWSLLLYLAATKTQVSGGYDAGSIITLAVMCLAGGLCYLISRGWLKTKGVSLDLAMHKLPPE